MELCQVQCLTMSGALTDLLLPSSLLAVGNGDIVSLPITTQCKVVTTRFFVSDPTKVNNASIVNQVVVDGSITGQPSPPPPTHVSYLWLSVQIQYVVNDANISVFGLPPPPTCISYLWPSVLGQYVVGDANISIQPSPPAPTCMSYLQLLTQVWYVVGDAKYICVQPSPPVPTHASYLWLSAQIQYVVGDVNISVSSPLPPPPPLTCLSYLWLLAWVWYVVGDANIPPPPCSYHVSHAPTRSTCSVYGLSKLESKLKDLQLLIHMATEAS
ncbi:hypothetical protein EDC04DRAFT_2612518 [Pisolithus marmoratus]|nr:hypothetical protein EDC04DRAFT_2612518 [Pisolithus marmoratus]